MRVGTVMVVLALGGGPARADDEVPVVHETEEQPNESGPLVLDPVFLSPRLQGLGTVETGEQIQLRLGPRTRARFVGAWWQNEDSVLPAVDVPGLGWRAGLEVVHDFGFAQLITAASLNHVETGFGRGRYVNAGLALRRTWKLSRWTALWLQLGFGVQSWIGDAPAGERSGGTFSLTLGGTFK